MGHISEVIFLTAKKKMGRPTDNPKGTSIHVRLDKESDAILGMYCKQKQVHKTEAVRRGIKKLKDALKKRRKRLTLVKVQPLPHTATVARRLLQRKYYIIRSKFFQGVVGKRIRKGLKFVCITEKNLNFL